MTLSLLMSLGGAPALAQDTMNPEAVLIWTEQTLPDEKTRSKAERDVGTLVHHYYGADLAFPPQPWGEADVQAYETLGRAVENGRTRWDEFDIELEVITTVTEALGPINLVRDSDDAKALVQANLLYGAAVDLAFTEEEFKTLADAAPHRIEMPGLVANRALLDVLALDSQTAFTRSELAAGGAYKELGTLRKNYVSLGGSTLDLSSVPDGAVLVVDGVAKTEVPDELPLKAGRHYIHVELDGVIAGRAKLDVVAGEALAMPVLVDEQELIQADRRVALSASDGLPQDVTDAVRSISAMHPGVPVFLGSVDSEGKVSMVPYTADASFREKEAVTFTLGAGVGPAFVRTPMFWYADNELPGGGNESIYAPAANGSFDLELGIYNFAILASAEVYITPVHQMLWGAPADGASDENNATPVYMKPTGGIGVYALRPTKQEKRPILLLAGQYGWFSPGHLGPGGKVTFGFPTKRPGNWITLSLHGWYGQEMEGYPPDASLLAGGLRIGLQSQI